MSEKRFEPSRRKIESARRGGKTYKSQLITGVGMVVGLVYYATHNIKHLPWVGNRMLLECIDINNTSHLLGLAVEGWKYVLNFAGGCLILSFLVSVVGAVLQGVFVSPALVAPRWSRLNFLLGLKKIIGSLLPGSGAILLKLLLVLPVLIPVLFLGLSGLLRAGGAEPEYLSELWWALVQSILWWGAGILLLIAVHEYLLRRRHFFRDLYMTREELEREQRDQEGAPALKAQRKAMFHELLNASVPKRLHGAKIVFVRRVKGD